VAGSTEPWAGEKLVFGFSALSEIGELLAGAGSLETLSASLLRLVSGSLGASHGALLSYDGQLAQLELLAASRGCQLDQGKLPLAPELAHELAAQRTPFDLSAPPAPLGGYLQRHAAELSGLRASMWVPLVTRGGLVGVLSLSGKFTGERYDQADLELLAVVAQNVALALRNYQLVVSLKEANFQLNRKIVELEALHEMGLTITALAGIDELPDTVLLRAVSLCDAGAGTLLLRGAGGELNVAAAFGLDKSALEEACAGPLGRVVAAETPLVLNEPAPALRALPCHKLLAVPLVVGDKHLGALIVCDKERRHGYEDFGPADVRSLSSLAAQAGVAFENARLYREALEKERLEKELEIAAAIQRALLPTELPRRPDLDLAALTVSTRQVGGDYYDVIALPDGRLIVVIADVSGKGVPAALLVSTLNATLHAEVEQRSELLAEDPAACFDLAALVSKLNRRVYASSTRNKFITFYIALCDLSAGELRVVNAGHNYPIVVRSDGAVERPPEGGFFLGIFESAQYAASKLSLGPGDLLCLFTDGVSEARDPRGQEFGEERLVELLAQLRDQPARAIVEAIQGELANFTRGVPQYDDITMVLLRRVAAV
jgi:sigma-B regulation protein RsbU (phosphoserine phosphatase)